MKIGDMIETQTGYHGLIVGAEMMYPRHPQSPVRHFEVLWLETSRQQMGLRGKHEPVGKVSPFSVKKVMRGEQVDEE